MDTYYLFLDESKPNGHNINSLCLAGIIIKKEVYENKIIKTVNNLKTETLSTADIILHEVDIRNAKVDDYKLFRKKEIRDKFWDELRNIFSFNEFKFIGASINYTEFASFYKDAFINDPYFIVTILKHLYDGQVDLKDRFGFKQMP